MTITTNAHVHPLTDAELAFYGDRLIDEIQLIGKYDGMVIAYCVPLDIYYPLTPCCGASAKGLDGIVCRGCYEYIDASYAMAWDGKEWAREMRLTSNI